jgi:hypothetical protein
MRYRAADLRRHGWTPPETLQIEGAERARERDPALGGFAHIRTYGAEGLVADEAARRHFFGEDLAR